SIFLSSDLSSVPVQRRMSSNQALALLVLLGPKLKDASHELVGSIGRQPIGRADEVRVSASPLADGVLVRIAGLRVETVRQRVSEFLSFLPDRLGDDPFARKW
ncbi:MAG TPA: urease accessory protein UreD, partial [Verrucomicrobiota bacterium]|nr:urease accessory protein UreD [Verrucomicrobiota bacterium]